MSNLVVKMMSNEDLADTNTSKGFTLAEAFGEVRCVRDENGIPRIEIPLENGSIGVYQPEGNSYIIKNGKTVATFAYDQSKNALLGATSGFKSAKVKDLINHNHSNYQTPSNTGNVDGVDSANANMHNAMKAFHPESFYKSIVDNWNAYRFFPNWIYNKNKLEIPKGKHETLIVHSDLLTKDVLLDFTEAGYVMIDTIINPTVVDISFQVLVHKEFSNNKPMLKLSSETVATIINDDVADKLLRLPIQHLPLLVCLPITKRGLSSATLLIENFYKHEPNLSAGPNSDVYSLNITTNSCITYANQNAVINVDASVDTITLDKEQLYVSGKPTALVGKGISFIVIHNYTKIETPYLSKLTKDLSYLGYNQARDIDAVIFWFAGYSDEILKHQTVVDRNWKDSTEYTQGIPHTILVPFTDISEVSSITHYFNYTDKKAVYTPKLGLCVMFEGSYSDKLDSGEPETVHIRDKDLLEFLLEKTLYAALPAVIIPEGDAIKWADKVFDKHDNEYCGYRKVLTNADKLNEFELIKI